MRGSTIRKEDRHSDRFWSRPPFRLAIVIVFFATIILACSSQPPGIPDEVA